MRIVVEPTAEADLEQTVQPCPETAVVTVTFVYPDETDDEHRDAVPKVPWAPQEQTATTFSFKFAAEDEHEVDICWKSERWSPVEHNDYAANVQPNHTTNVTITLHACMRERWLGVSEVFGSQRIYALKTEDDASYSNLSFERLSAASEALGGPALTAVNPAAGFIRDQFTPIASFDRCSEVEADNTPHSRLLVHAGGFNLEHVGIEQVLPALSGSSQGGNVTVSPPTPNCPYGALIIGVGRCWPHDLAAYEGAVLQPIVPLHAARGNVEHTDEFVGFAGGPGNWKMVCASSDLALRLLERLLVQREGLLNEHIIPGCVAGPSAEFTRDQGRAGFIMRTRRGFYQAQGAACQANKEYLVETLGLGAAQVVDVPVLKHRSVPNASNFLPTNGGVVIPKQHSFRISVDEAAAIFGDLFNDTDIAGLIASSRYVEFWANAEMTYRDVARTHTPDAQARFWPDFASPQYDETLGLRAAQIAHANDAEVGEPVDEHSIVRIPCPADTADLFDAYLYLLYRSLNIPMRSVISAKLNDGGGNIHCATNYCPNFGALPFAHYPEGVDDLEALRDALLDPATTADMGAVTTRKEDVTDTAEDAIAAVEDD